MKRNLSIVILLLTMLLYQAEAISSVIQSQTVLIPNRSKGKDQNIFFSEISSYLFCLPGKSNDSNGQKTISGTYFSQSSDFYSGSSRNSEDIYFRNFINKYISDSSKIIIFFRKKDMIFPFHYFW